jgi:hypothetical protein
MLSLDLSDDFCQGPKEAPGDGRCQVAFQA